jgi:hypothetical protein
VYISVTNDSHTVIRIKVRAAVAPDKSVSKTNCPFFFIKTPANVLIYFKTLPNSQRCFTAYSWPAIATVARLTTEYWSFTLAILQKKKLITRKSSLSVA